MPDYAVIRFEDGVRDIVTSEWLIGRFKCHYPTARAEDLMLRHVNPTSLEGLKYEWEVHNLNIVSRRGNPFCIIIGFILVCYIFINRRKISNQSEFFLEL